MAYTYGPAPRRGKAIVLTSAPAYSFGRRNTAGAVGDEGPGPGAYYDGGEQRPPAPRGRVTVFGSGRNVQHGSVTPGPSDYTPGLGATSPKAPAYSLGAKADPRAEASKAPGPGQYPVGTMPTRAASPSYSLAARLAPPKANSRSPAPNAYNPKVEGSRQVASLKGRWHDAEGGAALPGPNAYGTAERGSTRREPAYTFGVSRSPDKSNAPNSAPGPGTYSPPAPPTHPTAFPRSQRHVSTANPAPGPGTYQPCYFDSTFLSTPQFSLTGRAGLSLTPVTPGPQEYEQSVTPVRPTSPQFTFRGVTLQNSGSRTPGPGMYKAYMADKVRLHTAPAFSLAPRLHPPTSHSRRPGPQEYWPIVGGRSRPPVTLKFRHEAKGDPDAPGPFEYTPGVWSGSPAYSMGLRLKPGGTGYKSDVGPGQYGVHDSTIGNWGVRQLVH